MISRCYWGRGISRTKKIINDLKSIEKLRKIIDIANELIKARQKR